MLPGGDIKSLYINSVLYQTGLRYMQLSQGPQFPRFQQDILPRPFPICCLEHSCRYGYLSSLVKFLSLCSSSKIFRSDPGRKVPASVSLLGNPMHFAEDHVIIGIGCHQNVEIQPPCVLHKWKESVILTIRCMLLVSRRIR